MDMKNTTVRRHCEAEVRSQDEGAATLRMSAEPQGDVEAEEQGSMGLRGNNLAIFGRPLLRPAPPLFCSNQEQPLVSPQFMHL